MVKIAKYVAKLPDMLGAERVNEIAEAFNSSHGQFGEQVRRLLNLITVYRYDWQSGRAGYARYSDFTIGLNGELFVEGRESAKEATLTHEIAHHIAKDVYGEKGHGSWWKYTMTLLEARAKRCHNYTFIKRAKRAKKYAYVCKDCGYTYRTAKPLKNEAFRFHGACTSMPNRGRLVRTYNEMKRAA